MFGEIYKSHKGNRFLKHGRLGHDCKLGNSLAGRVQVARYFRYCFFATFELLKVLENISSFSIFFSHQPRSLDPFRWIKKPFFELILLDKILL